MNSHALRVLEYDRVREILASYAMSPLGKALAGALEPGGDAATIERRLREADEMRRLTAIARVPLRGFKDVATSIRTLAEGGRPAEPELLWDTVELLRGAVALREVLKREPDEFPELAALGEGIADVPELREAIERSIDTEGDVRDDATPRLAELRAELRRKRESIRERITRRLAEPKLQRALQAEGIKFKNDRYLLPVRAEHRQAVPGVIRDRSQSGATLYIEPEDLVVEGDALLALIDDERAEVRRILWELTRAVLAAEATLRAVQEAVAHVDLTCAKARFAADYRLTTPALTDPDEAFDLVLRDARHPYLMWLARGRAESGDGSSGEGRAAIDRVHEEVVPLDISLGNGRRLLVVTGPNTGGKTVALKTIGLCVLMGVSGVPVPAAEGSRIPMISDLFADIGDEQSIEQSLSTFSSHLTHIREILATGDARALVLLDELGAGTDPIEGAALATSLLEWFDRSSWHGVITTHLGSLKEFAFRCDGAENASMQFDPVSLKPTFRMVVGLPGVSHALEIARRLGVPGEIVDEAQSAIDRVQGPSREVIEKMEHTHRRMERERRRMERLRRRAQGERRAAESEREEARAERDAWRKEAELLADDVIRSARGKIVPLLEKLKSVPKQHRAVVDELRWVVELLLAETPLGERREAFVRSLKKEDEVFVPKFGEKCKVRKVNKTNRIVTVLLNGIPTEVGFDDVSWVET